MAAAKSQRIGIIIIAIVLGVGTLGSFVAIILADKNTAIDQQSQQAQLDEAKKQQEALQATYKPLDGYSATAFDKASVTELKTEVLQEGDGDTLKADSTITANYFGWTSDGKIFDTTNKAGTTTPIDFSLSQVIEGWTKGLTGQKVGSTVKLTIPASQAYGDTDDGSGRPVGPLMFIVEIKAKK